MVSVAPIYRVLLRGSRITERAVPCAKRRRKGKSGKTNPFAAHGMRRARSRRPQFSGLACAGPVTARLRWLRVDKKLRKKFAKRTQLRRVRIRAVRMVTVWSLTGRVAREGRMWRIVKDQRRGTCAIVVNAPRRVCSIGSRQRTACKNLKRTQSGRRGLDGI